MQHPTLNERWQAWGLTERPIIKRRFDDGVNHEVYLVEYQGEERVLKIFSHDLSTAIQVQESFSHLGLTPKVIVWNAEFCLMERVETPHKLDSQRVLANIAESLKKLHSQKIGGLSYFDLNAYCEEYLQNASPEVIQFHKLFEPALRQFQVDQTPFTVCHNDLVSENILLSPHRAQFIDWEFVEFNNPWFDLASIAVYQKLSDNDELFFLKTYDPQYAREATSPMFTTAKISVICLDILWKAMKFNNFDSIETQEKITQLRTLANQIGMNA